MSSAKLKWPVAPIVEAVERTGMGVRALAIERGLPMNKALNYADSVATSLREDDGLVTLQTMDGLCVEVLGVHPIQVYGMAYFDHDLDGVKPLKPCRGCGGPKGPGDAHYCGSCRQARAGRS